MSCASLSRSSRRSATQQILDACETTGADLHPIVKRLDALIRETIPGLQYAIKWKKAYYGRSELGWIIEIVAYDVSVNVAFLRRRGFRPSAAARGH